MYLTRASFLLGFLKSLIYERKDFLQGTNMPQLRQHNNILLLSCKKSPTGLVGIERLRL